MKKYPTVWLEEQEYRKAYTQMRMGMSVIFDFMRVDDKLPVQYQYGLGVYVDGAIDEACRR